VPPSLARSPGILGSSPALRRVLTLTARYAPTHRSVLITGETGTGKESLARTVHDASGRTGDYVVVSCANLSAELFESELFGHEKGSFTGATATSRGLAMAADRGTLFLDEVGELTLPQQAKLLRFLQERTVRPVGGQRERVVDVRVVAATHRDLGTMVAAGTFRADLYYRLDELRLHLAPLRERGEDVVEIARAVVAGFATEAGIGPRTLTRGAEAALRAHAWPGNVRDLRRVLNRLALATTRSDGAITGTLVREELGQGARPRDPAKAVLAMLAEAGTASITEIAVKLRVARKTVQRWVCALVERDEVVRLGQGKASRYALPGSAVVTATTARRPRRRAEADAEVVGRETPSPVTVPPEGLASEPPRASSALASSHPAWKAANELLDEDGRVTRQTLARRAGLSERHATRIIGELAAAGVLQREGAAGRWCAYVRPVGVRR
jgi:transcriptional regulator with GAF, ATPase, and Fis domain